MFLNGLDELDATIFVDRLTGSKNIGLSKEQIAKKYNLTHHDVEIKIELISHKLITFIRTNKQEAPLLSIFIEDLIEQLFITDSAAKTYQLLRRGYDNEQISSIRHLKMNTIHDHIVEIAYVDYNFDITEIVAKEEVVEILRSIRKLKTRKLKVLKENLNNKYSFFQIRLVLAVDQTKTWKGGLD
nr:helix-turn-helix domain-containing protein [Aquibacillus saliphilus]